MPLDYNDLIQTRQSGNATIGSICKIIIYNTSAFAPGRTLKHVYNQVTGGVVSNVELYLTLDAPWWMGQFASGQAGMNIISRGRQDHAIEIKIRALGLNDLLIRQLERLPSNLFALVQTFNLAKDNYYFIGSPEAGLRLTKLETETTDLHSKTPSHILTFECETNFYPPVGYVDPDTF